jgi:ATP-dependent DNA helicase RecG
VVTVAVTVEKHRPPPPHRPRAPYNIETSDDTNTLTITYFNARKDYLEKLFRSASSLRLRVTTRLRRPSADGASRPRRRRGGLAQLPLIDPVYPLTEGLASAWRAQGNRQRARARPEAAGMAGCGLAQAQQLSGFCRGACTASTVRRRRTIWNEPEGAAWSRLAYDELLAGQLALALLRAHMRKRAGRGSSAEGRLARPRYRRPALLADAVAGSAPSPTSSPISRNRNRMLRLLHGDVGSGKTVVALLAAATVIEAGRQAALMAPTEILARQHFSTIAKFAAAAGIRVAILTGRERGRSAGNSRRRSRPATSI